MNVFIFLFNFHIMKCMKKTPASASVDSLCDFFPGIMS